MPAIVHYQTLLRKLSFFITSSFALNICLIVFGCVCCVHIYALHRDKFDPCALKCVFWDTPTHKKGINVFVLVLINILCPWMFNFVNMSLISLMSFWVLLGEIKCKEEEKLWLEEKKWIFGEGDESSVLWEPKLEKEKPVRKLGHFMCSTCNLVREIRLLLLWLHDIG